MDYQSSHYFGAQYQQQQLQQRPPPQGLPLPQPPKMQVPKTHCPVFSTSVPLTARFEEQKRREKAAELTTRTHQQQQQSTMRMDTMVDRDAPFYSGQDPRSREFMANSAGHLRQQQPPPHPSSMYYQEPIRSRPMEVRSYPQQQVVRRQLQPMVDIGDELNGVERSRLPVHYRLGHAGVGGVGGGVGGKGGMAKARRLPSGVLVGPRPILGNGIRKAATAERNRYNQLGLAAGGSGVSVHQRLGIRRNIASRLGKKITPNTNNANRVRRNNIDPPKKGNLKTKGSLNTVDPPSKDDLDNELESYMAQSKNYLDRQLDSYMKEANSLGVKKGAPDQKQQEVVNMDE